jgi:acetyltransferase-like isoleucine patch superfamily enzyme
MIIAWIWLGFWTGDHYETIIVDAVWIGHGAIIIAGLTIGLGFVVAAGAVVVNDAPRYSIVAGVPASHEDAVYARRNSTPRTSTGLLG